jgi:hypothetical protein
MNFNLLQTTYFLIFIIIAVTLYVVTPVLYTSFNDASDTYARSQIQRIQGEMFFVEQKRGSFQHACYTGNIGGLVQDLIKEYGKKVVCRTNDDNSQMIVYAELRNGGYYCVDSFGVSCEINHEPSKGFSCKYF